MKSNSWIIVRIADNKAILETYNPAIVAKINTQKYMAIPAYEYLCNLNKHIAAN